MTSVYYNEIDPYCAAWLQNLIDAGHIPFGIVDTRSIEDIAPYELEGYTQCHFFAGIGGWSLALRLAGWPDSRRVWTGSCPCQPFSAAGKGAGFDDERHLWPAWQHLIAQCRPAVIFGEQVASKAVDAWINLVHADLEGMGYAFGSVPFPAAGVGAPHIRDRNYWVADSDSERRTRLQRQGSSRLDSRDDFERAQLGLRLGCEAIGLADAASSGRREECADGGGLNAGDSAQGVAARLEHGGSGGGLADAYGRDASAERKQRSGEQRQFAQDGNALRVADSDSGQRDGFAVMRGNERNGADAGRSQGFGGASTCGEAVRPGPTNGQWADADWLGCTDGKWRPVEPKSSALAPRLPRGVGSVCTDPEFYAKRENQGSRVGRLKGYGNAIVPQQAAEFVSAYLDAEPASLTRESECGVLA
jgi:DNA (cytosine-5)-methyltransferase 1